MDPVEKDATIRVEDASQESRRNEQVVDPDEAPMNLQAYLALAVG